ncbi:MAG: hypothetical protein AAB215_09320 [Planctomycetota bacterium]
MRLRPLSPRGQALLALLGLGLLSVFFLREILFEGRQLVAGDTFQYFYPLKKMVADDVRRGEPPLWTSAMHSGTPLHAGMQAATFYPGSALFYLLPFDLAYRANALAHFLLASFGMFLLLRGWRLGVLPSAVGAATYAFSGFPVSMLDTPNILMSMAWFPLVLHLFRRALESPSAGRAAAAALALAAQILAGDPANAYYSLLLLGAYGAVSVGRAALVRHEPGLAARRAGALAAALLLAFGLAFCQIGPARDLAALSTRAAGVPFAEAARHPIAPVHFWTLAAPYLFGNSQRDAFDWERIFAPHYPLLRTLHLGLLPLLLVPAAFAFRRDRRVFFLAGVLAAGLLLCTGGIFYEAAYRALPLFASLRYPMKAFFLVIFAAAALAAFGAQALSRPEGEEGAPLDERAGRRLRILLGAAAAAAALALAFATADHAAGLSDGWVRRAAGPKAEAATALLPYMKERALEAGVRLALLAIGAFLLFRAPSGRAWLAPALCAFLLLDLVPATRQSLASAPASFYSPDLVPSPLSRDPSRFRICHFPLNLRDHPPPGLLRLPAGPYNPTRPVLDPAEYREWNRSILSSNYGTLFGFEYADGYESANLAWHNAFLGAVESAPPADRPRLLGIANVKYVFADARTDIPDLSPLLRDRFGTALFENRRFLPRARFVPAAEIAADDESALSRLRSPLFDPARTAILVRGGGPGSIGDSPAPLAPPPAGAAAPAAPPPPLASVPVSILSRGNLLTEIEVSAPAPGCVVLADAYHPAWSATLNGSPAPVFRTNLAFMSVPVPAGLAKISLSFETGPFYRAAHVSLAALALCLLLLAANFIRRRRRIRTAAS